MVDPDNEERLLKIPPRVVSEIKAEAYVAARRAVRDAQHKVPIDLLSDNWRTDIEHRLDIINAIDALMEEQ
jgi:hypothetical protein